MKPQLPVSSSIKKVGGLRRKDVIAKTTKHLRLQGGDFRPWKATNHCLSKFLKPLNWGSMKSKEHVKNWQTIKSQLII